MNTEDWSTLGLDTILEHEERESMALHTAESAAFAGLVQEQRNSIAATAPHSRQHTRQPVPVRGHALVGSPSSAHARQGSRAAISRGGGNRTTRAHNQQLGRQTSRSGGATNRGQQSQRNLPTWEAHNSGTGDNAVLGRATTVRELSLIHI